MSHFARVSALLLTAAIGACAAPDTDTVIDFGDSEDRLGAFDKDIHLVYPEETEMEGNLVVSKKEGLEAGLVVSAPLYVLDVPQSGTMHVVVKTTGVLDFFTDDMEFQILAENDLGDWEVANIIMEYKRDDKVQTFSKLEFFDKITYTPSRDFLVAEQDAIGEISDEGVGLAGKTRLGILVVPAEAWGQDIRGQYDFTLEADCCGRPCRSDSATDDSDESKDEPPADTTPPQLPPEQPQGEGYDYSGISIHGSKPSSLGVMQP